MKSGRGASPELLRDEQAVAWQQHLHEGPPTHWIRALVGTAGLAEMDHEVLWAVASRLRAERSDLDAVRDLIPDPDAWINLEIDLRARSPNTTGPCRDACRDVYPRGGWDLPRPATAARPPLPPSSPKMFWKGTW